MKGTKVLFIESPLDTFLGGREQPVLIRLY